MKAAGMRNVLCSSFVLYLYSEPGNPLAVGLSERAVDIYAAEQHRLHNSAGTAVQTHFCVSSYIHYLGG